MPTEFSRLLSEHQGRLFAYILSLVFDRHVADDVLQETNVVLCKKADEFEPGTNFKAWALRIASFEVKRQRRTKERDRLVLDDDLDGKLQADAEEEDGHYEARRNKLLSCLQKLTEDQRSLIAERYFEGASVAKIAAAGRRSPNSISQALVRARRSLIDCVSREAPGRVLARRRPSTR